MKPLRRLTTFSNVLLGGAALLLPAACNSSSEQALERSSALGAAAPPVGPEDDFGGTGPGLSSCLGAIAGSDVNGNGSLYWDHYVRPTSVAGKSTFLGHRIWDTSNADVYMLKGIKSCLNFGAEVTPYVIELDCGVRTAHASGEPDPSACIWTRRLRKPLGTGPAPSAFTISYGGLGPVVGISLALVQEVVSMVMTARANIGAAPGGDAGARASLAALVQELTKKTATDPQIQAKMGFSFNLAASVLFTLTIDRNGEWYISAGPAVGLGSPWSVSANAVWAFGLPNAGPGTKNAFEKWFTGTSWSACAGVGWTGCVIHSGPFLTPNVGDYGMTLGLTIPPTPFGSVSWGNTLPVCATRQDGTELQETNHCFCPANTTDAGKPPSGDACMCAPGYRRVVSGGLHLFDNGLSCVPDTRPVASSPVPGPSPTCGELPSDTACDDPGGATPNGWGEGAPQGPADSGPLFTAPNWGWPPSAEAPSAPIPMAPPANLCPGGTFDFATGRCTYSSPGCVVTDRTMVRTGSPPMSGIVATELCSAPGRNLTYCITNQASKSRRSENSNPGCGSAGGSSNTNEFVSTSASVASIDLDCDGHDDALFTTNFRQTVSRPYSNNPACPPLAQETYNLSFRRGGADEHSYYAFGHSYQSWVLEP